MKLWAVLALVAIVGVVIYLVTSPRWRSWWFAERGDLDRAWTEALAGVPGGPATELQLAEVLAAILADPSTAAQRRKTALTTLAALGANARPALPELLEILGSSSAPEAEIQLAVHAAAAVGDASLPVVSQLLPHLADPHEPAYGPVASWALLGRYYRDSGGPLPALAEQARRSFLEGSFGRGSTLPAAFLTALALAELGGSHWDLVLSQLRTCAPDLAYAPALGLGLAGELPPEVLRGLCAVFETEPVTSRRLGAAAFALALHGEGARAAEGIIRGRLRELCLVDPAVDYYPVVTTIWLLALMHPRSPETLELVLDLFAAAPRWRADLLLVVAMHEGAGDETVNWLLEHMAEGQGVRYELAITALLIEPGNPEAEAVVSELLAANHRETQVGWSMTRMAVQANVGLFERVVEGFLSRDTTGARSDVFDQHMRIASLLGAGAGGLVKILRDPRHSGPGLWHVDSRHRALAHLGPTGIAAIVDELEASSRPGVGLGQERRLRNVASLEILGDLGADARIAVPKLLDLCENATKSASRKAAAVALMRIAGGDPRARDSLRACTSAQPHGDQLDLALAGLDVAPPDIGRIRRVLELLASGEVSESSQEGIARRLDRARRALRAARR